MQHKRARCATSVFMNPFRRTSPHCPKYYFATPVLCCGCPQLQRAAANRYKKACSVKTAEATLQFEEYRDKAQRKIDALQAKRGPRLSRIAISRRRCQGRSRCDGLVQGMSEHRCSSSRTSSAAPPSEKTVKSASRISRSTPDERAFQSQRDLELEELHNLFRECKHDAAAIIARLEVGARCPPPPCHWNSKPATFPPTFAARAR